jgi:hypothetical protein
MVATSRTNSFVYLGFAAQTCVGHSCASDLQSCA